MIMHCFTIISIGLYIQLIAAAPVPQNLKSHEDTEPIRFFDELNKHDYSEYMNGILKELESDKEVLREIEKNSGASSVEEFAEYLNKATEKSRNKLDEIKRREIERLNHLESELEKVQHNSNQSFVKNDKTVNGSHIATSDNSRFTTEDLKALINRATHDINMADRAAEMQYRRMQIRKRVKARLQIIETKDPEERQKLRKKISESRKKRRLHSRLHEPGSKQQFEEVWSTHDNLDPDSFNSKTFFKLHDLNQDDHWDIAEVEALVQIDVDKVASTVENAADNEEKFHETMKMRQHIMEKMDTNKDQLISLDEFLHFEKTADFKKDEEWKTSEDIDSPLDIDDNLEAYKEEISYIMNEKIDPMETVGSQSLPLKL